MNNTKQNNNTEDSFSERQDVTCSEGEAVTELSPSSGSPLDSIDPKRSHFSNNGNYFYHFLRDDISDEHGKICVSDATSEGEMKIKFNSTKDFLEFYNGLKRFISRLGYISKDQD